MVSSRFPHHWDHKLRVCILTSTASLKILLLKLVAMLKMIQVLIQPPMVCAPVWDRLQGSTKYTGKPCPLQSYYEAFLGCAESAIPNCACSVHAKVVCGVFLYLTSQTCDWLLWCFTLGWSSCLPAKMYAQCYSLQSQFRTDWSHTIWGMSWASP